MDENEPVAVTVVTGFLGAGKTTLLNHWLAEFVRGEAAVVVNEFGAVGVDGELLAERAREVVELTGGCVCCTTQGELVAALRDLATRENRPRRVFVETSGAASPAGVLRAIHRNPAAESMRLDGVITVADAARIAALWDNDLALEQLAYADVVVLSRAGECSREQLAAARGGVLARNPAAVVSGADRGAVVEPDAGSLSALLAERMRDFDAPPRIITPARGHTRAIESVSLSLAGEVDEEAFGAWVESQLARFGGRILRIKGVIAVAGLDERMVLQGVADQVEVTFGAAWEQGRERASRVVVLGYGLDGDALRESFAACAVR